MVKVQFVRKIDKSFLDIDIDLSVGRTGEQSIHKVFLDPGGSHCIATVTGVGGAETFYTHANWLKPRVLSRLKGLVVNAVAWNRQQITEGYVVVLSNESAIFFFVLTWINIDFVLSFPEFSFY